MSISREQILELLRKDREFMEEVRRLILTKELLNLPQQMAILTQRVNDLATQAQELAQVQRRMLVDMGEMKGKVGEMAYRERAYGYFGDIVRRVKVIEGDRFWDILEEALNSGQITPEEERKVRLADIIIHGFREGRATWLVVEVSWTIEKGDIERASERASIWEKCVGGKVLPVVAGHEADEHVREVAWRAGVWLILDGKAEPPKEGGLKNSRT